MKKPLLGLLSAVLAFTPLLVKAQDTINPYDENVIDFLESIDIHVEPTEYLWSQQDFVAFISKQKEVEAGYRQLSDAFIKVLSDSFDMIELGAQVNDPRFEAAFGSLSPEQIAELKNAKAEIEAELMNFDLDESLSAFFLLGFFQGLNDFSWDEEDYYYEGDAFVLDAWAEPAYVQAGNIVWLKAETEADLASTSFAWEQAYGPEVTWLNTDSLTDAAFIAPAYSEEEPYLEFILTAENADGIVERYVYVDYEEALETEASL